MVAEGDEFSDMTSIEAACCNAAKDFRVVKKDARFLLDSRLEDILSTEVTDSNREEPDDSIRSLTLDFISDPGSKLLLLPDFFRGGKASITGQSRDLKNSRYF